MPMCQSRPAFLLLVLFSSGSGRADADLPSPLFLADVLGALSHRSLTVAEKRNLAASGSARARAATHPDDPTASLEWWQQPVDFSTVPIMLTVRQAIPWPGKLRLRGEVGERDAVTLHDEAEEAARRVEAEAKRAYFALVLAEQSLAINDLQRTLLAQLVTTTDARYRVGRAEQADLFKAQSALLEIENERFDLERDGAVAGGDLNALLDRPADGPLGPTATAPLLTSLPAESALIAEALEHRPEVKKARDVLALAESRAALAKHESDPDLSVWGGYMHNFRGVDTFTAGVSATLPVFSSRRRLALAGAARLDVEAARNALSAVRRNTESGVHTAVLRLAAAARHARLHADKLIPLADLTLQSAQGAYQAGRIDFPAVLESARMVREHHLNHIRFLVEYERQLAELEQIVGADLRGGRGEASK